MQQPDGDGDPPVIPPVQPQSPSSATPLLRGADPAGPEAVATVTAATGSGSSSVRSRRGRANSTENDPLFDGLSRGLSDASAEEQRRMRRDRGSGSVSGSDDEEAKNPAPRVARRPSDQPPRQPGVGSPGSLASPLMSPNGAASPTAGGATTRRGGENVLRRHIRLFEGEFEIGRHDRAFIMSRKSWFEKCTHPDVDRTDLFPDNYIKSSRYEWYNFLPKNLYEQLAPWSKPANFYFCQSCDNSLVTARSYLLIYSC